MLVLSLDLRNTTMLHVNFISITSCTSCCHSEFSNRIKCYMCTYVIGRLALDIKT